MRNLSAAKMTFSRSAAAPQNCPYFLCSGHTGQKANQTVRGQQLATKHCFAKRGISCAKFACKLGYWDTHLPHMKGAATGEVSNLLFCLKIAAAVHVH
jgi:hypothetical protein